MNEIVEAKEEVIEFDYSLVDKETSEFLKEKEFVMREAVGTMETRLGKELKEVQSKLSQHGYGCFREWFESIGLRKTKVYELINRYDLIVRRADKQDLIENMPTTLVNEITKKNADSELKEKVLTGEIKTTKEYKQAIKEKEEAEEKAKQLEEENEQIKYRQEILLEENKELRSKPVEVRVEEKEVIPEHIKEKLLDLEEDKRELEKLKQAGMSVEEYEKRKREIEREVSEKSDEMASLIKRTREIQESYNKENNLNSKRGYLLSQIKASTEGLKARKTKIEQGFNALDSDVGEMLEATLEAEIGILNEVSDYFSEKLRISRATKIKGEIING